MYYCVSFLVYVICAYEEMSDAIMYVTNLHTPSICEWKDDSPVEKTLIV